MAAGGSNELNLTPFIDLFSVMICFLLMTAAWIQLESMPAQVEKKGDGAAAPLETPAPETKKVKLAVRLLPEKIVATEGDNTEEVLNVGGKPNEASIKKILQHWRKKYPDRKDLILDSEGTVTYGSMIHMYDLFIGSDWPDVGINPY